MTISNSLPMPPSALPDLPPTDFWTEPQWTVCFALLDAIIPSIAPESSLADKYHQIRISDDEFQRALELVNISMSEPPTEESFKALLAERPTTSAAFVEGFKRSIETLSDEHKAKLGIICKILTSRIGAFLFTGYCTPTHLLPVHIRQNIIQRWRNSRLTQLRVAAKLLQVLSQNFYFQTSPIFKQLTGYTDVPRDHKPGKGYDFQFMQFPAGDDVHIVETDVVIVGSGIGGSVCAKSLAEAGHKVIVVDKAHHIPPSQFPMPQSAGFHYLLENGGYIGADDGSAVLLAGNAWGGGGTINWSVSLHTQQFVREEWASKHGLPFFTSPEYQERLEKADRLMGVSSDNIRHNHGNRVILEGSRRLGWKAGVAPQNSGGAEHYCGQCFMGCGSNEKRGPTVSLLPPAAEAGAQFIEGFRVDKVIFDESSGPRKATGITGEWVSRDSEGGISGPAAERVTRSVEIRAKRVIISCGSLWSPVILKNSGLTNPQIGKNLHIHPCSMVAGIFKEDVRPWEGGIITSYCNEFENLDSAGHGVKLEPTCMVPYTFLATMPQSSGLKTKMFGLRYRHVNGFIALTRDRDSGRVFPDPVSGKPRVDYTVSDYDRAHTLEGTIALAKLNYVMGATEVRANFPSLEPFVRNEPDTNTSKTTAQSQINDPVFLAWLDRLREVGNKPPVGIWSSAHQMGTCRMSSSEENGVVDPNGRVWGCENLFVADASVFPSASGVNPMITNMAIADYIATGIDHGLKKEV